MVSLCSSSLQEICQALESLASAVAAVSASARKVPKRDSSLQEAEELQQRYQGILNQAKERQMVLEKLLAHWQR